MRGFRDSFAAMLSMGTERRESVKNLQREIGMIREKCTGVGGEWK